MAQTNRKRRRKHRGTQAGTVEARGRTSRPQPGSPRRSGTTGGRAGGRAARPNRYDKPPTWRGSATRALIPAAIFGVVVGITSKNSSTGPVAGLLAAIVVLFAYIPMTYMFDGYLYRRRQRQKQAGR
jgi:hypothetical protein